MQSIVKFLTLLLLVGSVMGLKDPICGLEPFEEGFNGATCKAYIPSYSYDSNTNECEYWVYGGCGANDNIFGTEEDCESKCKE